MYNILKKIGINPILHHAIDNEFKKLIKIETKGLNYQIALPGIHRMLPAKRTIQTFKNHFISTLYGCDPEFPTN